jgi:hypothetical protein
MCRPGGNLGFLQGGAADSWAFVGFHADEFILVSFLYFLQTPCAAAIVPMMAEELNELRESATLEIVSEK